MSAPSARDPPLLRVPNAAPQRATLTSSEVDGLIDEAGLLGADQQTRAYLHEVRR
jgi:hypothetical protein